MPPNRAFTTLIKIDKSPNNNVKNIAKIFCAVNEHGSNAQIVFGEGIDRSIGHGNHIQGIVAYRIPASDNRSAKNAVAVDWSSSSSGSIVFATQKTESPADALTDFDSTGQIYARFTGLPGTYLHGKHPGGLQICGDIIISAIEGVQDNTNAWLNFHSIDHETGGITTVKNTTITISPKASTAGLAYFKDHLIAAISREGNIIDIYTKDAKDIGIDGGGIKYCASWNAKDQKDKDRTDWCPNNKWRGAEGGGNLFVSGGKLYFIGFQREGDITGADWACLYSFNFEVGQASNSFTITKCAELHLILKGGGGLGRIADGVQVPMFLTMVNPCLLLSHLVEQRTSHARV